MGQDRSTSSSNVIDMISFHRDAGAAERLAQQIDETLPVWTLDEMLEAFDVNVSPAGWAKALMRLGVGAPLEETESVVSRVRQSVAHRESRVRRAAVWAMVYAAWPVFAEDLAQIARTDSDPQIAREAALAVEKLARSAS